MKKAIPVQRITLALCLLAVLLVPGGVRPASARESASINAPQAGVSGLVKEPDGSTPPAGTVVRLFEPDMEKFHGQAEVSPTGSFSFGPVANGLYVLKAIPPATSGLTQSMPVMVSVLGAAINLGTVYLTLPQVFGTVQAPGVGDASADVLVYLGNGQLFQSIPAISGQFLVGGLPDGAYALQAIPTGSQPAWRSPIKGINVSDTSPTQTVSLQLQAAELWGSVHDDQGNPVIGAKVLVVSGSGHHQQDLSRAGGFWSIGGLDSGNYLLTVLPPWPDSGWVPPAPITVSLPYSGNPIDLVFLAPHKIVSGTVKTNTNLPVFQAMVSATRLNKPGQAQTFSENDGSYQLHLGPGLWALTVSPVTDTIPGGWVFPKPPQLVHFRNDNDPESKSQNFVVVLPDASVTGSIKMPDGVSTPPFTVTIALHNDEGVGIHTAMKPDGSFAISVPNGGYKVLVHPDNPAYLGPVVDPISLAPNSTLNLGALSLLARDAAITGTVTDDQGNGVPGIPLAAWRDGVPGNLNTASGPEGEYILPVSTGTWHIQPAPSPDQAYLYTGGGQSVTLSSGATIPNIDFDLATADAVISGVLVDSSGNPLSEVSGWATARNTSDPAIHNGAPIEDGTFEIHIPAGTYHVTAFLPAGSSYMSDSEKSVTVGAGASVAITMTLRQVDAAIAGALWDPRTQLVVSGVDGRAGAWSDGSWAADAIDPDNGSYHLDVASGLWHLNYHVDPASGYVKSEEGRNIPVPSGKTVGVSLPVLQRDALITGIVKAPDGSPLAGATVTARGMGMDVQDLDLRTLSRLDGSFSLAVPYGKYILGASKPGTSWIRPKEAPVQVQPGGTTDGHLLQFLSPNATLSGNLTVNNTNAGGNVLVWAWSDNGGFVSRTFPVIQEGSSGQAHGVYSLGVISNETWHVGAVFETSSQYWSGSADVTLGSGDAVQDLVLTGPHAKPAPVAVTFDASQAQSIQLTDGTQIYIPAGAMPVTGRVSLRIVPIAALPHQKHFNLLKYGYAFLATDENGQPIEAHFNQDVAIRFSYSQAELDALHIHEDFLKPVYFSTTQDEWTIPDSYVVDTAANVVSMEIDHFTDFALIGDPSYSVFIPVISR
jgi:hypothetical protein